MSILEIAYCAENRWFKYSCVYLTWIYSAIFLLLDSMCDDPTTITFQSRGEMRGFIINGTDKIYRN